MWAVVCQPRKLRSGNDPPVCRSPEWRIGGWKVFDIVWGRCGKTGVAGLLY